MRVRSHFFFFYPAEEVASRAAEWALGIGVFSPLPGALFRPPRTMLSPEVCLVPPASSLGLVPKLHTQAYGPSLTFPQSV